MVTELNVDESVVTQLVEMGFPVEACRKGVHLTGNTGVEAAMNWVMSHMDDPGRSLANATATSGFMSSTNTKHNNFVIKLFFFNYINRTYIKSMLWLRIQLGLGLKSGLWLRIQLGLGLKSGLRLRCIFCSPLRRHEPLPHSLSIHNLAVAAVLSELTGYSQI